MPRCGMSMRHEQILQRCWSWTPLWSSLLQRSWGSWRRGSAPKKRRKRIVIKAYSTHHLPPPWQSVYFILYSLVPLHIRSGVFLWTVAIYEQFLKQMCFVSFLFTGLNVTMCQSRGKMLVNFKMEKRKKVLVCQFHPCPSFLTSVNVTNPIDGVCCLAATFKKTFLVAYSVGVYSEFYPWPHLSTAFRPAERFFFNFSIPNLWEKVS